MNLTLIIRTTVLPALFASTLVACGGSSGNSSDQEPVIKEPPIVINPVEGAPVNTISHAYFRDQDGDTGTISGTITLTISEIEETQQNKTESMWIYWADAEGNKVDGANSEPWLKVGSFNTDSNASVTLLIPKGTPILGDESQKAQALLLYPNNSHGEASEGTLIKFHDFIGNTQLSGPGGNYLFPWYYGVPTSDTDVDGFPVEFPELREAISIHRSEAGLCTFDNGLVSIIDMNYERDTAWEAGRNNGTNTQANIADDNLFPFYQYPCGEIPLNTHRYVGDEDGAWLYSSINDAMFYGTLVYDTYVKYLGEPPINDKLRIRVHYGSMGTPTGYWDGTYATFGDGIPLQLSASSLDSIGHEVGHGVLNRLMGVDFFSSDDISKTFRTLHEAFSDISGVMAWYEYVQKVGEYNGETNYWLHGEENQGRTRKLDQIVTEYGAIETLLDYDETEPDYYLSLGMFTYPFYLLQQQWGMEQAYSLYIAAARNCWTTTMSHAEYAQCLKQQAALISQQKAEDVVAAFKTVKIKLFDDGVIGHYTFEKSKLRVQFTDDSRSTNLSTTSQVSEWLWDFGDSTTSTEQNPQHNYAAAGNYQVKLIVKDSQNNSDDLTRNVSVTDQYCSISSGIVPDHYIGQVVINGTDINFNAEQSDYRDLTPIALIDPNNKTLTLSINGASNTAVVKTTKWTVWLDINDDGFYSADEIVSEEVIAAGQPYGINTSIDLTDFLAAANLLSGDPRFIRVTGENRYNDACSSAQGEAFDVRIAW